MLDDTYPAVGWKKIYGSAMPSARNHLPKTGGAVVNQPFSIKPDAGLEQQEKKSPNEKK